MVCYFQVKGPNKRHDVLYSKRKKKKKKKQLRNQQTLKIVFNYPDLSY